MPEGPEIRLAADEIAKVLLDETVVELEFGLPRLKRFVKPLKGRVVTAVDTRGKAMLTRFDNGLTLYSHNQLYGRWYTAKRPALPDTGRSLRVALHTQTHSALLYSASDIEVLTPQQLERHPFLNRVGPDILDRGLTTDDVAKRLLDPRFRNRSLGSLYLDQAFLAGNGNYLRSETLHVARVHPAAKPSQLDARRLRELARLTLTISRRSYRTRGITVVPEIDKTLRAKGLPFERRRFYVFGRAGQPCRTCRQKIRITTVGSRRLYLCPRCQPRR
ncbi:MAG: endonuclease VIII [Pseudomonadota bacterium]